MMRDCLLFRFPAAPGQPACPYPPIVLSGTGGAPNGTYYVLTSTNVALPLVNWTRVTTNLFDGTGGFSATNVVDLNVPQQFFLLQLP